MKNTVILVVLMLSAFGALRAQPAGTPANGNGSGSANGESPAAAVKKGVVVPPEKARPITIPKLAVPITIDGRIDEEAWKNAAVFGDFYQTAPGNNIAPSKPTEVYVMYDEKNFYIAFKCFDERDKIRATVAKRDNVFGEDNVRVWLDTFNDRRRAYVLGFNPLGIQQDGIFTEGQGADFSVDIVMESKGVIEDWGWSVEVKIPFKSIRYKAGKGTFWGFNAARNIDRFNDEFDQWLPDDRDVSGFLIKHGRITGLDDVKYERTLEVVPSITVSETGNRVAAREIAAGRFVNEPIKQQLGVSLKYTITPSVTLDATINPDFAEIEADAPVVTANQRFPIYYEEKRPFFLEGVDIFRSPLQVFYSRNIVDPDVAVKLTGKTGKTTFGLLAASDNAPGNYSESERYDPYIRPRINEFLDKNAMFGILRLKRDFGSENNIGLFTTYRSFPEQKNFVTGIDGRMKWTPKLSTVFQVVGTTSRRCFFDPEFDPVADPGQAATNRATCGGGSFGGVTVQGSPYQQYRTGNGVGYYVNIDYSTDRHGWFAEAGGRTKYYRADSGFTRRTDSHFGFFFNRFSSTSKPKANIIRASWAQMTGINYDDSGRLQDWNVETNVNLNLQRSTFLYVGGGTSYGKIYEEEFGLKRNANRPGTFLGEPFRKTWSQHVSGELNQIPSKKFNYGVYGGMHRNAFDYFYYDPTTGLQDPGPGLQIQGGIYFEVKPIDPFRFSVNYNKSRMVRNDNKRRSFDSDIVSIRSTYQFSRFVFTRFRLDYEDDGNTFGGQLLFGWTPSPGTAFYVGYNDNLTRKGFNPYTGDFEPGFVRNSRTFFIRASYLFRKSF